MTARVGSTATIGTRRRSTRSGIMDAKEIASQGEKGKEAHKEDHNGSRAEAQATSRKTARIKERAKEEKEKEKEDSKEGATIAENMDTQPRSAPKRVAKERIRAKEKPK